MSYTPQTWINGSGGATPISADRLLYMENGIAGALSDLVFNVKSSTYGAVGNGTADDTTPIQNAITAAIAAKGQVYLPPGTYKITSSLNVTAGTGFGFVGAGWGTIIAPAAGMNDWAIKFDSTSGSIMGAVFAHFKVDHNGANQTAGGGIYAKGAVQCLFDQLWITRPYDAGIWFNEISSGVIGHHNRIRASLFDNGSVSAGNGQGIRFQSCDENTVEACDFESMGGAGSEPYAIKDWSGIQVLAHNVVVGGKEGFRLQDVASTRVIGNTFDGVGRAAVHASGSKNVIMGNLFSDASTESSGAYAQCQVDNSTSAAIVGNSFTVNTSGVVRNCVRELSSSSSKTLVADNIIDVSGSLFSTNKAVELLGSRSKAVNNPGYVDGSVEQLNVKDFGAVGNGVADDTTAVQAAITAANSAGGGIVYFPAGTYLCTDLTIPGSNIQVRGSGWNSIIKQKFVSGDDHYLFSINAGTAGTSDPATNTRGLVFRDVQLRGTVDTDAFMQHVHLIFMSAVSDVLIENVFFNGFRGDGLYIGSGTVAGTERHNQRIKVRDSTFDGINKDNRNGISIIDGEDILVEGCVFKNMSRSDMPGAIDMEPNPGFSFGVIKNIRIMECTFDNIGGGSAILNYFWSGQPSFTTKSSDIRMISNTFKNCRIAYSFQMPYQPSSTDVPNDVLFAHNTIVACTADLMDLSGIRGFKAHHNTWINCLKSLALGYTYKVRDVFFDNESYHSCGTDNGRLIFLYRGSNVYFRNNNTDGINGEFVRFDVDGATTGASDNVCIYSNVLSGIAGSSLSSKHASHTLTLATNLARNNDLAGLATTTLDTTHFTPQMITATATYDPPSLATGAAANTTVTATGAAVGDVVLATHTSIETAATSWVITGYVSAANTVRVIILNATGGTVDLGSGTLRVKVFKQGFLN